MAELIEGLPAMQAQQQQQQQQPPLPLQACAATQPPAVYSLGSCGPIRVCLPALACCLQQQQQQQQQLQRKLQVAGADECMPELMPPHMPKSGSAPAGLDLLHGSPSSQSSSCSPDGRPGLPRAATHPSMPHAAAHPSPPGAPAPPAPGAPAGASQAALLDMFGSTQGAVLGLRTCLLGIASAAQAHAQAQVPGSTAALHEACVKGVVVAVRLGTDTRAHEHSVLLGIVAGSERAGACVAQLCAQEMGPLFC